MKRSFYIFLIPTLLMMGLITAVAQPEGNYTTYLPMVAVPEALPPSPTVEFRGLWVSRFDWTHDPTPAKIDEIVSNMAYAGFNVIFFQVRGEADAFYTPGLEPWSRRLTGTLGQDPGWDPLQYMIEKAHAEGIQVHAYLNVYPVWLGCEAPPSDTTPQHFYYKLLAEHGSSNGRLHGLQWTTGDQVLCADYQRSTPASVVGDDHYLAIGADLVTRYDIDGIHLDHIRYGSVAASCDPVSEFYYGTNCFGYNGDQLYADWQRAQVNGTVSKFYNEIVPLKEGLWLSAAVWPIYANRPEWGWPSVNEGYYDYYQDSKSWVLDEYIDSISPMIYPSQFNCPDNSFWSEGRWETLVEDFQADNGGRFIVPGIGTGYCSFAEIEARIELAREIGTAGHALFSYGSLLNFGYFDDLATGPYAEPATVPEITWHP